MLTKEENEKILKEEMEAIKNDILMIYSSSRKKTSGEFERGLEIEYNDLSATLKGYTYLGGRRAGKQPPIEAIEKWIKAKGLTPIDEKISTSSLAFLIARKIAEKGTKKENHLPIYTQIITPQRIDSILERISNLNANAFIQEVTATITKAFNDFQ